MSGTIANRLAELGITLPEAVAPVANYVPFRRSGNILFISGQLPMENGRPCCTGLVGAGVSLQDGVAAARLCAINILSQTAAALDGDLERVRACLKLGVFVAAAAEFRDHPQVANGASDLMVAVLGDAGRHARAAVGMASLPLGVPVEVEAIFEVA